MSPKSIGIVAAIAGWLWLTVWTIRWLGKASRRAESPIVFGGGVGAFGMTAWVWSIFWMAKVMLEDGGHSDVWLWVLGTAFVQLPVCLWAGYVFGRVLQAAVNALRR
jgi:hypothetical protein